MPIYEYRCECGATFEVLERLGAKRETCEGVCVRNPAQNRRVERVLSGGMLRGTGHEASEPTFDPCKRSNRPGGDCL